MKIEIEHTQVERNIRGKKNKLMESKFLGSRGRGQ